MAEKEKSAIDELADAINKSRKEMDEAIASMAGSAGEEPKENPDGEKVSGASEEETNDKEQKETSNSEKSSQDTEKTTTGEEQNKSKSSKGIEDVCAGISKAYGDDGDDVLKAMPQTTSNEGKSSWPKPPARGKNDIKVADGKDIMEVFWNEMWKLYDNILDFVVDTALDFVVFVLYPEKSATNDKKVKKADVFAAGEEVCEEECKKIDKIIAEAIAKHKEISDNLQRAINGEETEWKLQKEPKRFSKLVEIKKKAIENPNSQEAKFINNFEKIPEIFDKMGKNCKKIIKSTVSLATMDEYIHPTTKKDEIKKAEEQYKDNPNELKKKLDEIDSIYRDPAKEQGKMKERIKRNFFIHYNTMIANISKIKNANRDNSQKLQEELKNYMTPIKEILADAQNLIYNNMYRKGNDGKKNKKLAIVKIAAAVNAVNGTIESATEGVHIDQKLQKIASTLATMGEILSPSAKAAEIEEAKKQYKNNPDELKKKLKEIEKEYNNPETLKKKTNHRIKEMSDKHYQKIKDTLDKIEHKYANNPEEKKKALTEYENQILNTLRETKEKVYVEIAKGNSPNAYLYEELIKVNNEENNKVAANEEANVYEWPKKGVFNLIKDSCGLDK